jgi:Kef-type K+ transport system membrane component KefB
MPTLPPDVRASVLCALLAMLLASQLFGWLFQKAGQPRVAGELLGGLLLGVSGLGVVWPDAHTYLFRYSDASTWALTFITWAGLMLLMYASGHETLDLAYRPVWRRVAWITAIGTAIPLALGYALGRHVDLSAFYGDKATPVSFGIFLGMVIAVTAIPVLSRILLDLGLMGTPFGRTVMAVALVEDLVLWAGLAILLDLGTGAGTSPSQIALRVFTTLAYFAVCFLWGHKALHALARLPWLKGAPDGVLTVVCLLVVVLVGHALGVRMIFGAFLAGRIVGRAFPGHRSERTGVTVLATIFFASVGLRVDLTHGFNLVALAALLVVAIGSKSLATWIGARLAGIPNIGSIHLSIVLNARGALGIVLATIGLEAQLIDLKAFSTLIVFALLTSMLAGTWLQMVQQRHPEQLDLGDEMPEPARDVAKVPMAV